MPTNAAYRRALMELAALAVVAGENPFKARAFERAARAVEALDGLVDDRIAAGTLRQIDGIGAAIEAELVGLRRDGRCPARTAYRAELPDGVLALMALRGLGPKKVRSLWTEHGIADLETLDRAARDGTLASIRGFGAKTVDAVLAELQRMRDLGDRTPFARALFTATRVAERVAAEVPGARVELAGQLARAVELVDRVDLLVQGPPLADLEPTLAGFGYRDPAGTWRVDGVELCLHPSAIEHRGLAELLATADSEHLEAIDALARQAGVDLSDPRSLGDDAQSVERVYRRLGVALLPAPLREGDRGLVAHDEGWLPDLPTLADLRGDLHMHTRWSDGTASVAEMAAAAAARGREYIAITDHSGSLTVANGLDAKRLAAQLDEIDAYNAGSPACRVLKGLEVDVLPDGSLDMADELLARLDWVVGSVHTHFAQPRTEMTRRVIRAIDSGRIHAIGHPTARKIGARNGLEIDLEPVFDAAEAAGVAVEINASPLRLDLGAADLERALLRPALWLVIDTDAHSVAELDNLRFGVATAQRGWVPRDRVLNRLPVEALLAEIGRTNPARPA